MLVNAHFMHIEKFGDREELCFIFTSDEKQCGHRLESTERAYFAH